MEIIVEEFKDERVGFTEGPSTAVCVALLREERYVKGRIGDPVKLSHKSCRYFAKN